MSTPNKGVDYAQALQSLRSSALPMRTDLPEKEALLSQYHPDYGQGARTTLPVGANAGEFCHPDLAELLLSRPLIDDFDLAGAVPMYTDVLVIGGGGAGAAAALTAAQAGAGVIMANKLRIGDSNTVMAEGGIAASLGNVESDDWHWHYYDTIKGGDWLVDQDAAKLLAEYAPQTVINLERQGVAFSRTEDGHIAQRRFGGHTREFGGAPVKRAAYAADPLWPLNKTAAALCSIRVVPVVAVTTGSSTTKGMACVCSACVSARMPDTEFQSHIKMDEKIPVLVIKQVALDQQQRPIEYSISHCRSDLYVFVCEE